MDAIHVEDLRGTLQTESCGFSYYDGNRAHLANKPHQGGVTFDLLNREMLG